MSKGYWVVKANIEDSEEYSKYIEKATLVVDNFKGNLITTTQLTDVMEKAKKAVKNHPPKTVKTPLILYTALSLPQALSANDVAIATEKVTKVVDNGNLSEVAKGADIVITMLPNGDIVEEVYDDVSEALFPIAKWSLESHLIKLYEEDRIKKEVLFNDNLSAFNKRSENKKY